jgi:hypothetical protein
MLVTGANGGHITGVNNTESVFDRVTARALRLEHLIIRLLQHEGTRLSMSEAQEYASELLDAIIAAKNDIDAVPDRSQEWRTSKHAEFDFLYRVLAKSVGPICQ